MNNTTKVAPNIWTKHDEACKPPSKKAVQEIGAEAALAVALSMGTSGSKEQNDPSDIVKLKTGRDARQQ